MTEQGEMWKYALALTSVPTVPPEIGRLVWFHLMHELGILDDDEYRRAKANVLAAPPSSPRADPPSAPKQETQH